MPWGLMRGKSGASAQGEDFPVCPDLEWTSRGGTPERTHSDAQGTALGIHICECGVWKEEWNLKERVEFEGLTLMLGESYRLFLKFQLGIKYQTVLQKQQREIWWFCEWLYSMIVCTVLLLLFSKQLQQWFCNSAVTLKKKIHSILNHVILQLLLIWN